MLLSDFSEDTHLLASIEIFFNLCLDLDLIFLLSFFPSSLCGLLGTNLKSPEIHIFSFLFLLASGDLNLASNIFPGVSILGEKSIPILFKAILFFILSSKFFLEFFEKFQFFRIFVKKKFLRKKFKKFRFLTNIPSTVDLFSNILIAASKALTSLLLFLLKSLSPINPKSFKQLESNFSLKKQLDIQNRLLCIMTDKIYNVWFLILNVNFFDLDKS